MSGSGGSATATATAATSSRGGQPPPPPPQGQRRGQNQGNSRGRGGRGGRGGGRTTSRSGRTGSTSTSTATSSSTSTSTRSSGRGGRGRGRGSDAAAAAASATTAAGKPTKVDRKLGKRAKQLASMEKKAADEDAYFRQCQKEAKRMNANANANGNGNANANASTARTTKNEHELFGTQGSQGINFNKYDAIKVQVKHPTNDKAAEIVMTSFSDLATTTTKTKTTTSNGNGNGNGNGKNVAALTPQLQRNIALMNYTHPTPIQRHAIPLAMTGNKEDLMCCAQTGSGKTCAFLLPICAALAALPSSRNNPKGNNTKDSNNDSNNNNNSLQPAKPLCIVLAPTRELAMQIELEAQKLTHMIPNVRPVCVYGGASARGQLRDLAMASVSSSSSSSSSGVSLIVVATPGRLTDFVDRGIVSLGSVKYLCLDEADRMLDMGFEPQIRKLVQNSGMTAKTHRQTLMFSATFPPQIQKLAAEFLRDEYAWIAVGRVGSTTDSITQVIVKAAYPADKRRKLKLVVEALQNGPDGRTLVFVQKKRTATWLKKQLNQGGRPKENGTPDGDNGDNDDDERFPPIPASDIHGDRSQSQRESALADFRSGKCRVLVATDVAARGLDISGVEHVINMDLPTTKDDFDSYVHRIGRTGRAGHVGLATSIFVPGDDPKNANGKIAAPLVNQLKESGCVVPAWLEAEVAGGGGGGGGAQKRKEAFGGSDVRRGGDNGGKRQHQGGGRGGGRNSGSSNGRGRGRGSSSGRSIGGRGGRGRSGGGGTGEK